MVQEWQQNAHIAASYVMQHDATIGQHRNAIDNSTSRNTKYIITDTFEARQLTVNTYRVGLTSQQTVIRHTGEGHDL